MPDRPDQVAWKKLVAAYEKADAEASTAYLAADDELLSPAGRTDGPLQQEYERLRQTVDEYEEEILKLDPPNLVSLAYQLKVFALRYLGADFDEPPMESDAPGAYALRRIYETTLAMGAES